MIVYSANVKQINFEHMLSLISSDIRVYVKNYKSNLVEVTLLTVDRFLKYQKSISYVFFVDLLPKDIMYLSLLGIEAFSIEPQDLLTEYFINCKELE